MRLPVLIVQNPTNCPYATLVATGFAVWVGVSQDIIPVGFSGPVILYAGAKTDVGVQPEDYAARQIVYSLHMHSLCRRWGTDTPRGKILGIVNIESVNPTKSTHWDHLSRLDKAFFGPRKRVAYTGRRMMLATPIEPDEHPVRFGSNYSIETEHYSELHHLYQHFVTNG